MPIFFTQPICHGGDCLHIALLPLCRRPPCPQDNPLWPSISIMAGDLGLPRTFGRYRLADSIYSFWRIPRLPTRLIDSKCWDMTWCARWQPQQRLVARRGGGQAWFSRTNLRDGAYSWRASTGQTWWAAWLSTADNGTHSLVPSSLPQPLLSYRNWRRPWHASGTSIPYC